ncbi:hypothetical protein B0H21DRAFT_275997 [Amylocystis lapponica]|nr:hypothetical protein B0H21DRAFT_275997 [Amylocystis lapponica]
MSHLPPKPDFDTHAPLRYPPDPRYYGRPPVPPPDRSYRERGVYPPRSPPRSRPSADTYIAPRTIDTYMPSRPPVDSYLPPYDVRDDDRYRDVYRAREPPREHDWRGYQSQDYYRPKERSPEGDRRGWERDDWRPEDRRRWQEPDPRRVYTRERRERSPQRYRDTRPREDEWRPRNERVLEPRVQRSWESRPSRSPPRRMVSNQYTRPSDLPSPGRERSPASSVRPRSPDGSAERGRRRRTRSPSVSMRFRDHSDSVSPRGARNAESPRRIRHVLHPEDDGRRRGHQDSRSPSPLQSQQRDDSRGRYSPSPSPRREFRRGPLRAALPWPRSPAPARSVERSPRSRSPTPVTHEAVKVPLPPADEQHVESRAEEKGKMKEISSTFNHDDYVSKRDVAPLSPPPGRSVPPQPAREGSLSQLSQHRSGSPPAGLRSNPKSPVDLTSPQTLRSGLPPKPDWPRRGASSSTPADNAAPAESTATVQPETPVYVPETETRRYLPKPSASEDIELEIAKVRTHRLNLAAEYREIAKATRKALHELDMSTIDLKVAEQRRTNTDKHLELARAGTLGIQYAG